ncbi:tetratricopeptide repeat protein [Salidesulfovibrio onnuriiensis]|uniref:tetratricopeptide repeat protein n=1 Tax=Salidesulfovibrio onnuriiensis TaxID=2583823 RepID=UPI0011CC06E0|nr:tetratricopeptide repeat protein [Salidesulfovibrio onnuriiensis]
MKKTKHIAWVLAALAFAGSLWASPAAALGVRVNAAGDSDKLTLVFDSGAVPDYSVTRTGTTQITVAFPAGFWDKERKPDLTRLKASKLVSSIDISGNSLILNTKTKGFGFIRVNDPSKPQALVQVFRDPIGARWKPPSARTAKPAPKPVAPAASAPAAKPVPKPAPKVEQPAATAPQAPAPAAVPQGLLETDLTAGDSKRKPFFSMPHTVRTEVAPPPGAGNATAAHDMRFQATDRDAADVKMAELGNTTAAEAPVIDLPGAESLQGSGNVRGSVAPPPDELPLSGVVEGRQPVAPAPQPAMREEPGTAQAPTAQGSTTGTVAPPPSFEDVGPVSVATPQEAGAVKGAVVPPPSGDVPAQPVGDHVEQAVAPPPVVDEQPVPPAEPAQEQQAEAEGQAELAAEGEALPQEATELAQAQPEADNATLAAEDLVNKALEAQSLMLNGNLAAARDIFKEILPNPLLPDEYREEALYALGDIAMQLYKDDPADKYDEIAGAYTEALNYNPDSRKAPQALVNLGLINLKVGNLPEAKAYFSILQSKYPDDQVIPSISYYWGEYYFRKGDYRKAADQLQYLVQTYPENELVKNAAYLLADSLERLGYNKQAYQIVDYIDKRWPDYYMARPEFLLLAGGIEMRLQKYAQAKDHYFTYYNLNPEAEASDIALARIGDIYLTQGFKEPAREIYEKAVKQYPDKEGGLVAKMRLAEEGIYDDPTMVQMVSVFDRPYNLRPVQVYEEIVEKFPDGPLAPVAQLKMAMWYAFHKKYPEALTAAQDFIDKFPDSELLPRARELGDKVFALAVPGLVDDANYQRVVRYWEGYDFIGKGDTRVDDNTRLMVANSYWKLGQPGKALEIIEPYLGEKQIPDISNKAIDLAVGIYLDQYAWDSINKLIDRATTHWKLQPKQQRQLEYARAMALQNMGDPDKALPLWAELGMNPEVDPSFRGYAMYYMAKDAMKRQDLKRVFAYAQEALTLLLQTNGDPEKVKDAVLMSIYATERSGRYEEALKWARQYDQYITPDNPEWAPTRFKLARIYKKAGATEEWQKLLQDIIDKRPDSLQASLAKAALEDFKVERQARQYSPAPQ